MITILALCHGIIRNPEPEHAGTIKVHLTIFGYNSTFRAFSLVEEFINDDNNECRIKEDLKYFLMASGINDEDTTSVMIELIRHVNEVTSSASNNYSPECALGVYLFVRRNSQMEEAIRVSFDETNNIRFKPASKLVVKILTRKTYVKISSTGETCAICLEEFNHGGRLVTLPCGHEFDDECAVKWLETSHFCPLCRNELPCEDQ